MKARIWYVATDMAGRSREGVDFTVGQVAALPAELRGVRSDMSNRFDRYRWSPGYIEASRSALACSGARWPGRLFQVSPRGGLASDALKRDVVAQVTRGKFAVAAYEFDVLAEVDARQVLGPQAEQLIALQERARSLSDGEIFRLSMAQRASVAHRRGLTAIVGTTRDAMYFTRHPGCYSNTRKSRWWAANAVAAPVLPHFVPRRRPRTMTPARKDAGTGAHYVLQRTALALALRDVIPDDDYDLGTAIWRSVIGPIHPDDGDTLPDPIRWDGSAHQAAQIVTAIEALGGVARYDDGTGDSWDMPSIVVGPPDRPRRHHAGTWIDLHLVIAQEAACTR